MNARRLAQEAVSWYLSQADAFSSHQENVQEYLRRPVVALTLSILSTTEELDASAADEKASVQEEKKNGSDWRDYLAKENGSDTILEFHELNEKAYEALSRRTKARLEAFLAGVSLTVPAESKSSSSQQSSPASSPKKENRLPKLPVIRSTQPENSLSLVDGLAGFKPKEKQQSSPVLSSLNASGKGLLRSISSQSSVKSKRPQVREQDLITRLELYIRCLTRVKSQNQECVLGAEPARALKARARSVVLAFVDTVGTVQQQSPVLTRLMSCLTKELLAVDVLGGNLDRVIRRLVSDYEHKTSFASLAFLSSPDDSADQRLTPMIMEYLKYLQSDWKNCVSECELERMLSLSINQDLRQTFKTIEFRSIGHLLEVCQGYRSELTHIELAPGIRGTEEVNYTIDNNDAIRQAIRDLQREVITVNGHALPPVTSRKELINLLSQTLNSRTLSAAPKSRRKSRAVRRSESAPSLPSESDVSDSDGVLSSGNEADTDGHKLNGLATRKSRRKFNLSTVDFLTKRLLLAAGRTGTGGDAYFVVRDLFGGDDVEVVPSQVQPIHGRAIRPGTIDILVKLASVTIKCHASFDVYPKSLVGDCEPLIQLHTTTTEVIALQEVRAADSSDEGAKEDEYDSDNVERPHHPVMVVQERKTERTGWRTLAIRPALYEKVEVWNTPS